MDAIKKNALHEKLNKWLPWVLWVLIFAIRIPFLNGGIDYTDTGYNIMKYKNVFYGDGISDIGMFYTCLIGGFIYRILPAYHLLVYRILHLVIQIAIMAVSYNYFKKYVNRNVLLMFFLGFMTLLGGEMIYSYYPMSQLCLTIGIILLHSGLCNNKKWNVVLSGFVMGLSVFVRLTNVLYFVMFVAVIWYGVYKKHDIKKIVNNCLWAIIGAVIAFCITFALMSIFMGFDEVIKSFMGYVGVALGNSGAQIENFLGVYEKSGHSPIAIIKTVGMHGIQSIIIFVIFYIPMLVLGLVLNHIANKKNCNKLLNAVTILLWCVCSVVFAGKLSSVNMYIMGLAAIVFSLFIAIVGRKKYPEYSMLCVMNILTSLCSVLGTDRGLQRFFLTRMPQVVIIIVSICIIPRLWEETKLNNIISANIMRNWIRGFAVLLCITIFASGICVSVPTVYYDSPREDLTYKFGDEIPQLKGMKTADKRAEMYNQYYMVMHREELKDKEVALFGFFPLGLVMGPQKDYFESVDPCVDYPRFSVEMLLQNIVDKEEEGIVPVIVLSHVDRIHFGRDLDYGITSKAKQAVADYMLSLHDYNLYFDSEYFKVYVAEN